VDTARRAYDVIAAKFGPGVNGPFTVAVDTRQLSPTQLGATITELQHDAGVAGVTGPVYNADGSAAVLMIEPTTAPHEQATVQTLRRVRGQLPRGAYVAGLTVYFADISERVTQRLWLLITVVVGVGMVALAIALKAPVVAIKAALTSLLAMAATYGVLIALFHWGWGAAIFGLSGAVPLSSWAVILLFIVLFALSTTYEIFLVSRVREEWLTSGEARASVMRGLAATAPVGVSGAAIMVAGFLAFALDPDIVVKMLCVGAVVGVLINAVVIRMVLAPATMQILGAACWWCPGRRGR
jgi:RND superfamily putative drug exporter